MSNIDKIGEEQPGKIGFVTRTALCWEIVREAEGGGWLGKKLRLHKKAELFYKVIYLTATASISNRAPLGSSATWTQERAGASPVKYSA